MRIEFNGLDLGDDTLYNVRSIDGLDSLPDLTIGMAPKPRRHGSWLGGKLAQKRVITIGFDILGDPNDGYVTTRPKNALVNALQIMDVELPLIFELDYGEQPVMVNASVTALDLPITNNYTRMRSGTVEFTCTDPMKYSAEAKIAKATPPQVPAGAVYGQAYGFAYSVTSTEGGVITGTNKGNSPAPVVYQIIGPIGRPTITLTDANGVRATTFNLTLAATDRLDVDTATNRVTVNGVDRFGSASGALVADLVMRPGDTMIAFTGDDLGGPVKPTLHAEWRDATR